MTNVTLNVDVPTYAKSGVNPMVWAAMHYARQELLRKRRDIRRHRRDGSVLEHCMKVVEIADATKNIVGVQAALNTISTKQYSCPGCDYSPSVVSNAIDVLDALNQSKQLKAMSSVTAVTSANKKGKL